MIAIATSAPTKTHPAAEGVDEPLGDDGVEQRGVGADPRDEVAGAAGVEFADREAQHPAHQLAAGGQHDRVPVRCSR